METKILNHPLINHKLTYMRKKETSNRNFRQNLDEITSLLAYEVTRNLKTQKVEIETPVQKGFGEKLAKPIIIVPILRAGLGMIDGFKNVIPNAKFGHILIQRDEKTLEVKTHFNKFPNNLGAATVIVVDPMLATGSSIVACLDVLKNLGAKDLKFAALIGAPEGLKHLQNKHQDVEVYLAALDQKLNEKGYIVPGLGDAGDRIFGTEETSE